MCRQLEGGGMEVIMEYVIEYEETIRKTNSVAIEVGCMDEAEEIATKLAEKAGGFRHPDDILCALSAMGVDVLGVCKGVEDCEYEIC